MSRLYLDLQQLLAYSGRRCPENKYWAVLRHCVNPRFLPVVLIRVSIACHQGGFRAMGKVISLLNFLLFGIEVSLRCEIGPGLVLPHTCGTVIGASRIGRNALIYHQVTLGAKTMDIGYDPATRPEVGDDVTIGAGAKVLGRLTLHDGVTVGANAVVLESVPPGALVAGVPARIMRRRAGGKASSL